MISQTTDKGEGGMTALEILKAARELISDPAHWTQGVYARDEKGHSIGRFSPEACKFCSDGALMRTTDGSDDDRRNYWKAFHLLEDVAGDIIYFNDTHTHAEVLAVWDKAIASAEVAR